MSSLACFASEDLVATSIQVLPWFPERDVVWFGFSEHGCLFCSHRAGQCCLPACLTLVPVANDAMPCIRRGLGGGFLSSFAATPLRSLAAL